MIEDAEGSVWKEIAARNQNFADLLDLYDRLKTFRGKAPARQTDEWVEEVGDYRELLGGDRVRFRVARPYGHRAAICKAVSLKASHRFKVPVSTRQVRACWGEFNDLERHISQELAAEEPEVV
jgi:hypothetical protein